MSRAVLTAAVAAGCECCLNCGFGKSTSSGSERRCKCIGGPKEGKLVSPRFRCGKYHRWRPGQKTAGADRWRSADLY